MKILLIEPFFGGSHQQWAEGFQAHSSHDVHILSLPARHWKWRMYGGAVELAHQALQLDFKPDLLLATDMLDFTTFLALTQKQFAGIPTAIYFHENQITYPWSPTDQDVALQRNNQYGFINYTSALVADKVFFNSPYHLQSFCGALPSFLGQFPDNKSLQTIEIIREKSSVLPLGMDLRKLNILVQQKTSDVPTLLWNHRWEYDKNPDLFFESLLQLKAENIDFQLVILGENYKNAPPIFQKANEQLAQNIIHIGYAKSVEAYAKWLWRSDILPVTSHQDFFGGSVVEALYCNCCPILPKRLAYPMHISIDKHHEFFYDTDADFYEALKTTILAFPNKNENYTCRDFVARYDWLTLAPHYDTLFSEVRATNS